MNNISVALCLLRRHPCEGVHGQIKYKFNMLIYLLLPQPKLKHLFFTQAAIYLDVVHFI